MRSLPRSFCAKTINGILGLGFRVFFFFFFCQVRKIKERHILLAAANGDGKVIEFESRWGECGSYIAIDTYVYKYICTDVYMCGGNQ